MALSITLTLSGASASESSNLPAADGKEFCGSNINVLRESRRLMGPYRSLMCNYVLQRCHANFSFGLTVSYYKARLLSEKACCLAGGKCFEVTAPAIQSSLTLPTNTTNNEILSLGTVTWAQAQRPVGWACLLYKGGRIDKVMQNQTTSTISYNSCDTVV